MLLIESLATDALRWLRALPAAGSFPAPPCLIHGHPSALIAHRPGSPGKTHAGTHVYMKYVRTFTNTLTRANQGHE